MPALRFLCPDRSFVRRRRPAASSPAGSGAPSLNDKNSVAMIPTPAPIRVLLVDDHEMFRTALRGILGRQGDIAVVGEGCSGTTAIAMLGTLEVDVVVMDISLPDISGVDATRELLRRHHQLGVVALSGYDGVQYVRAMRAAGALGYVVKTAAPDELAEAIRAAAAGVVFIGSQVDGRAAFL